MVLTKRGQRGATVKQLQQWLKDNGFDPGPIDGIFGPKTEAGVRAFQSKAGIKVDGVVGDQTRGAMSSYRTEEESTPPPAPEPKPTETTDSGGGSTSSGGTNADKKDTDPAAKPTGETKTIPGVMGGGVLTKVVRADQDDVWGMTYAVNGVSHFFRFDSYDAMTAALGAEAVTSGTYGFRSISENQYDAGVLDGSIYDMGSATALVGQKGAYTEFFTDIQKRAALDAGVRDPGMMGKYLSDPAIQKIMASAIAGDWSPERVQSEIRNTNFYQNVMYPGISTILDKGTPEPESTWWNYHNSVEDNLQALGYEKDDDGSYRTQVKKLLEHGVSDTVFNQMAPVYLRAKNSPGFASALDYWLDKGAGRNVTFDDIYDALDGQAAGDLAQAVENATIQFQANISNLGLSDAQIQKIAQNTDLSEPEIKASFTEGEKSLLALGDRGLKRYGLNQDQLISAAFGLPTGDMTAQDIRNLANKTMREIGAQDDKKAQFYTGFTERGTTKKPGLQAVAPEAG